MTHSVRSKKLVPARRRTHNVYISLFFLKGEVAKEENSQLTYEVPTEVSIRLAKEGYDFGAFPAVLTALRHGPWQGHHPRHQAKEVSHLS